MSKIRVLFFICLGIAFYLLNVYTPIMHDDIAYLFKYGPPSDTRPTSVPIHSISDIFESQYYHYLDVNGRAPLHFLIQFFLLLGKPFFNLFNTSIFLALIFFIYKIVKPNDFKLSDSFVLLAFITACIWFTSPFIGQTMLWLTGACNYLLGSLIVIVFLYFLQKKHSHTSFSKLNFLMTLLVSLFCGWTQESISIGVSGALFFYYLFHKSEINTRRIAMILGFWLGTILIIVSPGTFNRVQNEIVVNNLEVLDQIVLKLLTVFNAIKIIKFSMLLMLVLSLLNYFVKTSLVDFVKRQSLYFLSAIFCFILVVIIGIPEDRILFGTNIILTIINASLFMLLIRGISNVFLNSFTFFISIALIYSFSIAYSDCKKYDSSYSDILQNIKDSKTGIVSVTKLKKSKYVYNTLDGVKDSYNFHNRVLGFYLHVPSITLLPAEVYNEFFPQNIICSDSNKITTWNFSFYWNNNFDYLVLDLKDKKISKFKPLVEFNYKDSDNKNLKFHQLFIRKALGTIGVQNELRDAFSLNYDNKSYLLIDRKGVDLASLKSFVIKTQNGVIISNSEN